jgi:catechol 2,3-dioxygenase-like lactoylglutathione lyase family enzyme
MKREYIPAPREGVIVTHFLVVRDQDISREWYRDVLGAEVVSERDPVMLKFHTSWLILNIGGGPTDDKPGVTLEPPGDPSRTSAFLNLRVADIQEVYEEWSARGAEFLTPPIDRIAEIRCYIRDPDGHLIEVGQATGFLESLEEGG